MVLWAADASFYLLVGAGGRLSFELRAGGSFIFAVVGGVDGVCGFAFCFDGGLYLLFVGDDEGFHS